MAIGLAKRARGMWAWRAIGRRGKAGRACRSGDPLAKGRLAGHVATALRIPVIELLFEGWTDVWPAEEIAGRSMRDAFPDTPRRLVADSGWFWVGNGYIRYKSAYDILF